MGLYVLVCNDKPNSLELRLANREAHLAYARGFAGRLKVAGIWQSKMSTLAKSCLPTSVWQAGTHHHGRQLTTGH